MSLVSYILLFFLFASFGSFFKLSADRYGTSDSVVFKPSYCFNCKNNLFWWQNIPVLSYIVLNGKCSFCKEKLDISLIYSEIITAVLSLILIIHGNSKHLPILTLMLTVLFFNVLICLSIYDLRHKVIPHKITYSAIFLVTIFYIFIQKSYLEPFFNLGVAFVSMDLLSVFSAAQKKYDFDSNLLVLPLLFWVTSFFFIQSFYVLIPTILIYVILLKSNFSLNRNRLIIFWTFLLAFLLFHFYRFVFAGINFDLLGNLFVGIGIIYFFCEIIFYYFVLIFSKFFLVEEVLENVNNDSPKLTIGGGDITVFVLISLFLGYQDAFMSLFLSSILALISIFFTKIVRYITKIKSEESQFISFVPYLTAACFIIILAFN